MRPNTLALGLATFLAAGVLRAEPASPTTKGETPVITVNGKAIARKELAQFRAMTGESSDSTALRRLIDYTLVAQQAKKLKITVSQSEVTSALGQKTIKADLALLKAGGIRKQGLEWDARYQLTMDKLLTSGIRVKDAALKTWFASREKYYSRPESIKIGYLLVKDRKRAERFATLLKNKKASFAELVKVLHKSKDSMEKESKVEIPTLVPNDPSGLPPEMRTALARIKPGQTTGVLDMDESLDGGYIILRLIDRTPAIKADFNKLKSQAGMDYRLEKVAMRLHSEEPGRTGFFQAVSQAINAMTEEPGRGKPPAYGEVLRTFNETKASRMLIKWRGEARLEVHDTAFNSIAEEFKLLAASPASSKK